MAKFKFDLGLMAADRVTGFEGRITGRTEYITGCNVYLLQPQVRDNNEFVEARWFDEPRLSQVSGVMILRLEEPASDKEKGADVFAPKK